MIKNLLKVVLLICIFKSIISAQGTDAFDQKLNTIFTKYSVAGMSVAVVNNNRVIFSKGYGLADIPRQIPVNSDSTLFRIASISKTVTGTAILKLYEQGKLKLNEDISRYLGYRVRNSSFPDDSITFIHLLTHTSGLMDGSWYDSFLSASYGSSIPKIKDLFTPGTSSYTNSMWTGYRPGVNFEYCNFAFGMLGTLVEKISGERFDIFCRKNIFQPLGMNSSFNVQDIPDINKFAALYRKSGGQWVAQYDDYKGVKPQPRDLTNYQTGDNGLVFSPQGGCRTSALDLCKFMLAHMNNGVYNGIRILNDTTINLMHRQHWSGSGLGGLYKMKGLAIHITDDLIPGMRMLGHSGEAYGLLSDMYFDINNRFGIVFMINGGNASGGSLFYGIEEEVFRNAFDLLIKNTLNVPEMNSIFRNFELYQNYPNPFNPNTEISFSLSRKTKVSIAIFNSLGQNIRNLIDHDYSAGNYACSWDGKNNSGYSVPSGLYYYTMNYCEGSVTKKMLLVK
jgi:CubicO group peptidase (beta-lactamase class C family)